MENAGTAQGSESAEQNLAADQRQEESSSLKVGVTGQLSLELNMPSTESLSNQSPNSDRAYDTLLAELGQLRSRAQHQDNRIRDLEQALDQSLICQKELRQQMVSQQFLEEQLASTEDIANIQQQAIVHLKNQLAQQQAMEGQLADAQSRDRRMQELLAALETLTQAQRSELEHLQSQIDGSDAKSHRSHLTPSDNFQTDLGVSPRPGEEIDTASTQTVVAHLKELLNEVQAQLRQVARRREDAVDRPTSVEMNLPHQVDTVLPALPRLAAPASRSEGASVRDGAKQRSLEELEAQLAQQMTSGALLEHAYQELEAECDRQQARLMELEQQSAEMQEQILRQAQQAHEYETAVQHWKDRYLTSYDQLQQLRAAIERVLPEPPEEVADLLVALRTAPLPVDLASPALLPLPSTNHSPPIDIPDFLLRRRRYKTKGRSGNNSQ